MTAEPNAAELYQEDEALEPSDSTLKAALGATLTLVALTILWEVLVRQFQVPAWLLPSPTLIIESMVEWRSELVG
ncbi:MAG TPA: ABC transporter permease, partial [Xanthobacteraceae bacterium]|nr:ABC transporter permease [Xanthobacteraceae bacterium]